MRNLRFIFLAALTSLTALVCAAMTCTPVMCIGHVVPKSFCSITVGAPRYKVNVYASPWDRTSKFPMSLAALEGEYYVRTLYLGDSLLQAIEAHLTRRRPRREPKWVSYRMFCQVCRPTDTLTLALGRGTLQYKERYYSLVSADLRFMQSFLTQAQVRAYFPVAILDQIK